MARVVMGIKIRRVESNGMYQRRAEAKTSEPKSAYGMMMMVEMLVLSSSVAENCER